MPVTVTEKEMTLEQAHAWITERGIDRLPQRDEVLQYIPPFTYNQYDLQRTGMNFSLKSSVLGK